jgi:amino acid transporter
MTLSSGANKVFLWLMNITTIGSLLTWISIAIYYLRFRSAIIAQGIGIENLPFKTSLQPYAAYFILIYFGVITLGNVFHVFTKGNWSTSDFIAAYIGLPIYIAFFTFWKIFKRTKFVKSESADLWTGRDHIVVAEE